MLTYIQSEGGGEEGGWSKERVRRVRRVCTKTRQNGNEGYLRSSECSEIFLTVYCCMIRG